MIFIAWNKNFESLMVGNRDITTLVNNSLFINNN